MTPSTRDRIVDAAIELFYERGYHTTSLKQVAQAAGVHGGSIYHFFPSKAALVEAVLGRYLELLDPVLMEPARQASTDPVERVMVLLGGYRAHLEGTGFTRGCPIGGLALELAESHPEARRLVEANFRAWSAGVASLLGDALPRSDAEPIGAFVLSVMEGAVMQARSTRSLAAFDASVAHLRSYLDRLLAEQEVSA